MADFASLLDTFDYEFPSASIAQEPASPRDAAKLLVYKKSSKEVFFDTFLNLPRYLSQNAVLVMNETKVIPARIHLKKATGGVVGILYVAKEGNLIKVMADRRLEPGAELFRGSKAVFRVERQDERFYVLVPLFAGDPVNFFERYGEAPIPPYIKHSPLSRGELKEKYQTVFAKRRGSVAAPTASLHFTERLMKKLKAAGFGLEFVTLHVNLGTFAPLTEENIEHNRLHLEELEISAPVAERLVRYKKEGRPIIAVGTTVVRALESAARGGVLRPGFGKTDLFIQENDGLKFVDGIITNFHVPRSSLLMLVSAFIGRKKLLDLYRQAIGRGFKLFSFGDGMLILD